MMRWFSSDLHFGHSNIIRYSGRPFDNVDEMNKGLIEAWNRTVAPEDDVWVLGDLAMGRLKFNVPLAADLNGDITLLCGNHDTPWLGRSPKTRAKNAELYAETGVTILDGETVTLEVDDKLVDCSHFPYQGDSQSVDRHLEHRPVDHGRWLLHGHVHEAWRQSGRQINVGVDAWAGVPVSEEQLVELIQAGPAERAPLAWTRH